MRLMSFAATTRQMYERTKTVTRRLDAKGTWLRVLTPGTLVCAVEKGQGIPRGEKVRRIGVIEIVSVRREPLRAIIGQIRGHATEMRIENVECIAEGFPDLFGAEFVDMFTALNKCAPDVEVTRIEFRHRPDLTTCCGAAKVTQWTDWPRGVGPAEAAPWRHRRCSACGEVQP